MRVGATAAERRKRRSLADGEWSLDTLTADVIADWEDMNPAARPVARLGAGGAAPAGPPRTVGKRTSGGTAR
jgi:hypothetical protein